MSKATKPGRGDAFRAEVLAAYELRPDERELVDEVAATLDVLAALPSGDLVEARQQRLVLARLLSQLGLSDVVDEGGAVDGKRLHAQKAANARWSRERLRKEQA